MRLLVLPKYTCPDCLFDYEELVSKDSLTITFKHLNFLPHEHLCDKETHSFTKNLSDFSVEV